MTESSLSPGVNQDSDRFDLILIGAGINGSGIARDATLRGLRVLVLDKGDVAGGTTSWSTRLIHGGLRYLEHREVGLVRESLQERERLLRIAPHLVRPLPLLLPIYRGDQARPVADPRRNGGLRRLVTRQIAAGSSRAQSRRGSRAGAGACRAWITRCGALPRCAGRVRGTTCPRERARCARPRSGDPHLSPRQ